jgi:hypothetical protein
MTVKSAERGAEVAVAGKPEIQTETCQVIIFAEEIERPGQAQAQLIAIKRKSFHLLENLCEINRRPMYFRGYFPQSPAPRQITSENKLDPVHQALTSVS